MTSKYYLVAVLYQQILYIPDMGEINGLSQVGMAKV